MYSFPKQSQEDEFQTCPMCNGCGCTCGATDCKRHCCEECHPTFGECLHEECGTVTSARYVEIQNEKLEMRRAGWSK